MKSGRNLRIGVAAVLFLGVSARVEAAERRNQITAECKGKLAADFGPLGKGSDIVRRLYPQFDPSTYVVKAEPSYPLLSCDLLLRREPVTSVAVVLQFPSAKDGDDSIFSDKYRYEVAEVRGDSLDQAKVARNPNALTREMLLKEDDHALPPRGHVRLDRATFALSESDVAVAVRFDFDTTADGYDAYLSEYDELALFRPDGQGLPMILMVSLVQTTTQVHCDDDDTGCSSEENKYIVRIAKHKTGGLYDLIVKNVSRKERPVTLQWNGKSYVAAPTAKK